MTYSFADDPNTGIVPPTCYKYTVTCAIQHPGRLRFLPYSMPTDVRINGCMIDHLAFPVDVVIHEDGRTEVIEE